jgi:hypothetical protein
MVIYNMKNIEKIYFLVGLTVAATAAILMFNGSIFGEKTIGMATVLTIFAISLLAKRSRT